jgi:integrase
MAKGIEERHSRSCRSRAGGRCDCEPTYRADVWDGRAQKRVRRTFHDPAEAKGWRRDALIALRRGRPVQAQRSDRLRDVAATWLDGARRGTIRTRSGDEYKPAAIRSYERALRLRVLDRLDEDGQRVGGLGDEPIDQISRVDLQDLVDELVKAGHAESTIEATLIPVRAIFRREVARGRLKVNPTTGLELPRADRRRDRIAAPDEAGRLLAALDGDDRALWATAMYAGLRRGELRALRVDRVDLEANVIRVERGWDDLEGEIATKGRNRRKVPLPQALREHLLSRLMRSGRRGDDLLFGETATVPLAPKKLTDRADAAWQAAKLDRITLHECRHTYASFMIAAGVNAKALSEYMGHSSIVVTIDRYGHLMPGNEDEAAGMLDAFLTRARVVAT